MKRVKLTVAYDGTNYCGWQVQPNGLAVQEVLNRCLSEFLGTETEVIGASRTDAGVHALGNVAVFDTEARMPAEKFSYALKVHRNYLVNHRYISWMYQQEAGLMDGTRIPVSQIYRKRIEQAFAENRKEMWQED